MRHLNDGRLSLGFLSGHSNNHLGFVKEKRNIFHIACLWLFKIACVRSSIVLGKSIVVLLAFVC